jgi:hypothetical protein
MISINSKRFKLIIKVGLIIFVSYLIGFVFFKLASFLKLAYEKDKLTSELQIKKQETLSLKRKVVNVKAKMVEVESKYIKKEEIDNKIKDIYKRMSVLDYNLKFLNSKKMCIDNYIIVTQLTARSEKGLKAGEGILSYLGEMKKSEKNNTIYFVNYISKPKDIKK